MNAAAQPFIHRSSESSLPMAESIAESYTPSSPVQVHLSPSPLQTDANTSGSQLSVLSELLRVQQQAVLQQEETVRLLTAQQAMLTAQLRQQQAQQRGEKINLTSKMAEGIGIMSAFIGGAMLSVLINPSEVLFGQLPGTWNGGACVGSCSMWQDIYGISSALSLTYLSVSLLLCIPVGLGQFNNYFSSAVILFILGLISMAVCVIATSWMAYALNIAIVTTVCMGIFIFSSLFIIFPCTVLAWYHLYGHRCKLRVYNARKGMHYVISDASILHFVAYTKWLVGLRGAVTKILLVVEPRLVHSTIGIGNRGNNPGLVGDTPLDLAAKLGRVGMMRALLDNGANINGLNDGLTPLHQAIMCGQAAAVRLLAQRGADLQAEDFEGRTPLRLAIDEFSTELVEILLENGADVNQQFEDGKTALHLAAEAETHPPKVLEEFIRFLLKKNANVNATDDHGRTPLHLAYEIGALRRIELLTTSNANAHVDELDFDGGPPFDFHVGEEPNELEELENASLLPRDIEPSDAQGSPGEGNV